MLDLHLPSAPLIVIAAVSLVRPMFHFIFMADDQFPFWFLFAKMIITSQHGAEIMAIMINSALLLALCVAIELAR